MMFYKLTTADDDVALEKIIDECGLASVLSAIAAICHDKAAHIRTYYTPAHDRDATIWERQGKAIDKLFAKLEDV